MIYQTIKPSEPLRPFVHFFWVLESEMPSYTHRSVADVGAELIFHYKGRFDELKADGGIEQSFIAGIHGPAQLSSRYATRESFGIFGVYLYPYALTALFGTPATALANAYTDLPSLLGWEGKELEEKMIEAASNKQRVGIITHFLERKLLKTTTSPALPIVSAIQFIQDTKGSIRVEDLANRYCLSERQFERKFKQFSGFSPKLFSRIVRFQAATQSLELTGKGSLTSVALSCGYYDQSHFIQEFKLFSGHTPSHFFSGQAEGTEWRQE